MQEFEFSSREHFERVLNDIQFPDLQMTKRGVEDIREGMQKGSNKITLYKVVIDNVDMILLVDLHRSEWSKFLEQAIQLFHESEEYELALTTWELNESLKKF